MSNLLPSLIDETASIRAAVDPVRVELTAILQDLEEAKFNRFTINQRLQLYASGDVDWRWKELGKERQREEGYKMKITIQIVLENTEQGQDGEAPIVEEIISFERTEEGDKLAPESLGLSLDEAKSLLAGVQKKLVSTQVTNYLSQKSDCPQCQKAYVHKGRHKISFSTLFGKLRLDSPRLWRKRWSR
jgi:hypothetical protein